MKKEIGISHLVVNGCSFTYCEGLENPTTQGWPALLAKKLNVPVVNLAIGGTGNHRIYRKTVDYFFKDIRSRPFYIIGMTSCTRIEYYNRHISDYVTFNLLESRNIHPRETHFIQKLSRIKDPLELVKDPVELEKAKLHLWLSIINLFRSTNTDYLVADMLDNGPLIKDELRKLHPKLFDYTINDSNHIKDYSKFTINLGKLPCGHYDEAAQIKIADYLYQELTDRYVVNTVDTDHLKLKDFYTDAEQQYAQVRKYNHWIF